MTVHVPNQTLVEGQVVLYENQKWAVGRVNFNRAILNPLFRRPNKKGKMRRPELVSVSPHSELKVVK